MYVLKVVHVQVPLTTWMNNYMIFDDNSIFGMRIGNPFIK